MSTEAILVDVNAVPRIITKLMPGTLIANRLLPVDVQVTNSMYQAHAKAGLSREEKNAGPLVALLDNFRGKADFSLWGLGDYRNEGPLLVCRFAGDGLSHFVVDFEFSESTLKLFDSFTSDQSCLKPFIEALQDLGS